MCSELIPSITKRLVLFVKELLFPQMAPTDDAFFNRTGLECVGVVGPEPGLLLDWSTGFGTVLLYKDKKEEGSARALPVAAPISQFLAGRKDRLLRERMFFVYLSPRG